MRANSSLRFLEISRKGIENNLQSESQTVNQKIVRQIVNHEVLLAHASTH